MSKHPLKGVIAAVPTPFSASREIDADAFVEHCRWCLDNGCDALNVLGTTGEANSLSFTQRSLVMEIAASSLDAGRLMVGTGTPDLATTVALTRRASELRYAAALVLPPFYYKPVPEDGIFAWFGRLVGQTQARPIDLYLYNFPQLTGIEFSPALAARLQSAFPDRIRGAKDSSGNLDYARQLAAIPGFAVFPSNEVSLADAGRDNYAGCISATVNIDPASSAALWKNQSDKALEENVRSLRQGVAAYPLVAAVKHLVGRRTGNPVWNNVAAPNMAIGDADALARLDALAGRLVHPA
jgi:4-hydroxy-tetrahydrodipicolinate synthase